LLDRVTKGVARPVPRDDFHYFLAEAELWVLTLSGERSSARTRELRRVMSDAAHAHVALLWGQDEDTPPTPDVLEKMGVWSARLCANRADGSGPDAHARHVERMRTLYADMKKSYDEGRDVSRVQVLQAAYFLREAELSSRIAGARR
jgi:hypothetical protein